MNEPIVKVRPIDTEYLIFFYLDFSLSQFSAVMSSLYVPTFVCPLFITALVGTTGHDQQMAILLLSSHLMDQSEQSR